MDGTVVRGTAIRVGDVAGMDAKVGAMRVGAAEGMSTVTTASGTAVGQPSTVAQDSTARSMLTVDSMAEVVFMGVDSMAVADAGKR
jgi:hypothetical protein